MGELNAKHNRAVWVDIPVAELDRAIQFYSEVLAIRVSKEQFGDIVFGVLEHGEGNGGCLVIQPENVSKTGMLVYLNVDGRIRDAVSKVPLLGGNVVEETHSIGPHGFRALVIDSEGNRLALHSETDA